MNRIIGALNDALTKCFDALLLPFSGISPIWGLLVISIVTGILLVLLYGKVSNQRKIRAVKRDIAALLFESYLFRHDIRVSLRAQLGLLKKAGAYFLLAVPPVLILAIPCIFVLAQLNLRYGSDALSSKERSLIMKVAVSDKKDLSKITLEENTSVVVTGPLRISEPPQVLWRIDEKPSTDGQAVSGLTAREVAMRIEGNSNTWSIPVAVGGPVDKIPTRIASSPLAALLYPGASFPSEFSQVVRDISLSYPTKHFRVLSYHLHWLLIFFVVSLVAGIIGGKIFGVSL